MIAKDIISIVLIASVVCANAQSVSVELSISWQKEKNTLSIAPFNAMDTIDVPYLVLSYHNHSDRNVYFKGPISRAAEYPFLPMFSDSHSIVDLSDVVAAPKVRFHEAFDVKVDYSPYLLSMWIVSNHDSIKADSDHIRHPVNYRISNIYKVLHVQSKLDKQFNDKTLSVFRYPWRSKISYRDARNLVDNDTSMLQLDFTKDDFRGGHMNKSVMQYFVFLKPNDTLTQKINLIGFLFAGGTFTFRISDTNSKSYVFGGYLKNTLNKFKYRKILLPKKCDGFHLYTGYFITNEATLDAVEK